MNIGMDHDSQRGRPIKMRLLARQIIFMKTSDTLTLVQSILTSVQDGIECYKILTTGQRYEFLESISNFFLNLWHKLWKSPGELCSEDREVIRIRSDMLSDGVFDLN